MDAFLATLKQACDLASQRAVAGLGAYRPNNARIKGAPSGYPGQIRLDRGMAAGYTTRGLVVILNDGKRVAKAVITAAGAFDSEAHIFEIEGKVRRGDMVRAIRDVIRTGANISPYNEIWAPTLNGNLLLFRHGTLPPSARIGSTRRALMSDFLEEGGLSSPLERTYVLKDQSIPSPYVTWGGILEPGGAHRAKTDLASQRRYFRDADGHFIKIIVKFKLVEDPGRNRFDESPDDVIVKISGPFSSRGLVFE